MHFDWTVSLGQVFIILSFLISAMAYGIRLDYSVKRIKDWIAAHEVCNKTQIEILTEVRGSLAYLRGMLDRRNGGIDLKEKY